MNEVNTVQTQFNHLGFLAKIKVYYLFFFAQRFVDRFLITVALILVPCLCIILAVQPVKYNNVSYKTSQTFTDHRTLL